jgi:hypothetical protein
MIFLENVPKSKYVSVEMGLRSASAILMFWGIRIAIPVPSTFLSA